MTQNRIQYVVPRRRSSISSQWQILSVSQRGSINPATTTISLGIFAIIAVALLSFFYLGQVQNTASRGTDIQSLEERIIELGEQQRALELEGAKLRSIKAIEERVPTFNLVTTDHVTYMNAPVDKVAAAE